MVKISKLLPLLFLFLFFSFETSSQICEGNLGENIFEAGDFGSGSANIPAADPQIAPGYVYTTQPPPNDGFYTLTNNMTVWSFVFDAWLHIPDNSDDPQGYMMVVNASFTPGLFYEQEVDGLCENTLYVFSADIINLIQTGTNIILPNVSFLIDGQEVYNTGQVPESEMWNTYGFTFTTDPGQTSVTLSLRNNAPGGAGNDLALDNITFRPCGPEALILPTEIANICEDGSPIDLEATIVGDQYDTPQLQWQQSFDEGQTWEDIPGENGLTFTHTNLAGGFYYYRYLLANDPSNLLNSKCRVVSNIKVVRVVPKFYTIVDTLCEGQSFILAGNEYAETGIYTDSLLTVIGCDSIVTLDLTVLPDGGIDAIFDPIEPSCDYLEDGSIALVAILNGEEPYEVYVGGALDPGGGDLTGLPAGDYDYRIVDRYGCTLDTTVRLPAPPPFTVELGADLEVDLGEAVELDPNFSLPAESFSWGPPELVDCEPDCESLVWTPVESNTYYLDAISTEGCVASDSIGIIVNEVRKVYIPNAFSPDGDGINDSFTIYGDVPNVQQIEQLTVFDRWGGEVFEEKGGFLPNDLGAGWDGTARGERLPAGIYTYLVKIRFLDEAIISYAGDVLLIR